MSEIRETSLVEDVTVPEPVPILTFAQLLADVGPLRRDVALITQIREPISFLKSSKDSSVVGLPPIVQLNRIMQGAKSVAEAVTLIAQHVPLNLAASEGAQWIRTLRAVSDTNDSAALKRAVILMVRNQQDRVQQQIISITASALKQRGFTDQNVKARDGLIVARKPGSTQMMTVDVARSKDGTIGMHYDLDGFYGGACVDELNGLQEDLAKIGVKTTTTASQRKYPRKAYDGRQLGNTQNQ